MKLLKKVLKWLFILVLAYFLILFVFTIVTETSYKFKYGSSVATENSEIIGSISIYSSPIDKFSRSRTTGHSWIYIENTSNAPFTINGNVVDVGKGITFGTTGHPSISPDGIWFNIESFNSSYLENISLTANFYREDLEQLEYYLSKHNRWNVLYNCATFSSGVWNNLYAGSQTPVFSISPKGLKRDMLKINGYEENEPFIFSKETFPYNEEINEISEN